MRYSLKGEENVRNYFYLNPDDGVLTLRKSLLFSSAMQFQVSLTKCGSNCQSGVSDKFLSLVNLNWVIGRFPRNCLLIVTKISLLMVESELVPFFYILNVVY